MHNSPNTVVYAIGHSTISIEKFIRILRAHSISLVADIRTIPRSRHNPQFNKEELRRSLDAAGIGYRHMNKLGGLRHPLKDSKNTAWRNASFRGYADYMQTEDFSGAIAELIDLASGKKIAIMCAEGNPFRCHRSLVADALLVRGVQVWHVTSEKAGRPHSLTPFAKVRGTRLTYPSVEL